MTATLLLSRWSGVPCSFSIVTSLAVAAAARTMPLLVAGMTGCCEENVIHVDADIVVPATVQATFTDWPAELLLRDYVADAPPPTRALLLGLICEASTDFVARWETAEGEWPRRVEAWMLAAPADVGDFPCGPIEPDDQFYVDDREKPDDAPQVADTLLEGGQCGSASVGQLELALR